MAMTAMAGRANNVAVNATARSMERLTKLALGESRIGRIVRVIVELARCWTDSRDVNTLETCVLIRTSAFSIRAAVVTVIISSSGMVGDAMKMQSGWNSRIATRRRPTLLAWGTAGSLRRR